MGISPLPPPPVVSNNLRTQHNHSILATRDTQFDQELALVMQTTHAQR